MTGQFLFPGRVLRQFCCTISTDMTKTNSTPRPLTVFKHREPTWQKSAVKAPPQTRLGLAPQCCHFGSSWGWVRPASDSEKVSRLCTTAPGPHTSCSWSSNSSVSGCGVSGSDNLKPDKCFSFPPPNTWNPKLLIDRTLHAYPGHVSVHWPGCRWVGAGKKN